MNKRWLTATFSLAAFLTVACSPNRPSYQTGGGEHYTSAGVVGNEQKINLDEVHKAFYDTAGSDFNSWMQNFEKRVNEIYQGQGVVGIDADKNNGMVRVTGYIDNGQQGYQPGSDQKIFELQQTGPANQSQGMPYQMTGYGGSPYYTGYPPQGYYHQSLLDNPFVQMFVLSRMLTPSWHYYTPPAHYTVIHRHVSSYRSTPAYKTQVKKNQGFFSNMFKKQPSQLKSQRGFGGSNSFGGTGTGAKNRSWFGGSSNDNRWGGRTRSNDGSSGGSSSGWGGRRSGGSSFGGSSSGGWGGRRSSGFGGRSFGGRRR